ncbi:MAG: aminopeptidase [Pseudomonadota bacterium]|nr:aminopeptidase [Pseudomonadota bacterium]
MPSCSLGYVLSSGYYQAELLASRRPIDKVLAEGGLGVGQEQRLRMIPEIKAYGKGLGLSATQNYDTIAEGWDRTIWNLSACAPLSFEPATWWFPVVGRVPYLGYFKEEDARRRETELLGEGYDVHLRTAGAYSTLGWFRDPVLPGMLRWTEADLSETVFHELAHATLWVPGSVMFNESFANYVGETAVERYLVDRYGPGNDALATLQRTNRDGARFEALLHQLYKDLDTVYRDTTIADVEKAARKTALYASLESRVLTAGFEDPVPYVNSIRRSGWNNARLMQFQVYNTNQAAFDAVLARNGGDLKKFIDDIGTITRGARDPFAALETAASATAIGADVQNP